MTHDTGEEWMWEEDFGGDLCKSLETSHGVTEGRE